MAKNNIVTTLMEENLEIDLVAPLEVAFGKVHSPFAGELRETADPTRRALK